MLKRIILEEAQAEFLKKDLQPLFYKYNNCHEKLLAQTQDGYKVIIGLKSLKQGNFPDIVSKFNPYTIENIRLWCKLNNKTFELVSELYENCEQRLQWRCLKNNCGEIFESCWRNIYNGNSCSYCRGFKIGLSNCLATKRPDLAKEWHPTKNGDLTPYDVTEFDGERIWWKCKDCGHEW